MSNQILDEELRDCFQELSNVAVGRAADLLARLLNTFVIMPIPVVNLLERAELSMALSSIEDAESVSAVCQGFTGSKIAGEALLIFNDASFTDMAELTHYTGEITKQIELELLMDISNILIGACLKGLAEQLDVRFSQGQPYLLGQHLNISELLKKNTTTWQRLLTIEIPYKLEGHQVNCDLLLLFTEDSLPVLRNKVSYLME
ncbi:histidine kinase [Reinekea marinisedimentorum]|uniref:Chemotaxis protein CheY-P-specific phosphatase CheC n=1 Tax=Reinekea marinisedimentorum TaxID=230495 RepID=A0A4R3IAB0_9GAMM|nr:histidine kinase [Reinekea marinisedimentorum]TCS43230.1 chemotaxis protein CheY-P-specific phosphatase CheC [Reinekea marinisedimentorum]